MFYDIQHTDFQNNYQQLLTIVGALSKLSSDSDTPYLYYRMAENIFCRAFGANNLARSDISIDAAKDSFSKQFMNTNQFYYAKLMCEGKSPSISCIMTTADNVRMLKGLPNLNKSIMKQIDALYNEGQQIIYHKLLK